MPLGDAGMGAGGEGVLAMRIRFAGTSFGRSVEKYIGTGPADVKRSCAVDP